MSSLIQSSEFEKGTLRYPEDFIDKVICGDCLEVIQHIPNDSVDLIIADIPYNEGKAEWDRISDYFAYIIPRLRISSQKLMSTGSLYIFHMNFKIFINLIQKIELETDLIFRQFVMIDKGLQSIAGRCGNDLRSWPRASEYMAFFTFHDETGYEKIKDEYIKPLNPFAKYLRDEFEKANVTRLEIAKLFPSITGGLTGCVSNWLNGDNIITKEQYLKIRGYLNNEYLRKEYEDLRKEYEDLRKEYEYLRYKFNLENGFTDIWHINFYRDFNPHPTAKPIDLIRPIIAAHTYEGDLVLDPFFGSGTTGVAAKQLNRHFIGIEINPEYCEMAEKRLRKMPERLDRWF